MLVRIILLVLCTGWVVGEYQTYDLANARELFHKFIENFKKFYRTIQEKEMRFKIFLENLHKIQRYNAKYREKIMGINSFTDLSMDEFLETHGCVTPMAFANNCSQFHYDRQLLKIKAPESFDWRDKGVVTPVKDQKTCGSCWAFSTLGNVEGQYAKKYNSQINLSEQQLVDCDSRNHGCDGGWMSSALLSIMDMGGVVSEADYAYEDAQGQCRFDASKVVAKIEGCLDFTGTSENDIKEVLVNYGPLTIALDASYMVNYHGGVLKDCSQNINHALLLVGYGTDQTTQEPYWIIKNSWNTHWGENGYLRLLRNNSDCEIGQHGVVTSLIA